MPSSSYRRGANVVAFDQNAEELAEVDRMFHSMADAGEPPAGASAEVVQGDVLALPFPDASFDAIIAAEVLEHIPDDVGAMAEIARVLKPGGRLAVTVPRWWPEKINWALSDSYHDIPGGHIRIYRGDEVLSRLSANGLTPRVSHHSHALHSPYWWLNCAFGRESLPSRTWHRLLVWDIVKAPRLTRTAEKLLNPGDGQEPGGLCRQARRPIRERECRGLSSTACRRCQGCYRPWTCGQQRSRSPRCRSRMALFRGFPAVTLTRGTTSNPRWR